MDSPSRPADAQRWLRFQNMATEAIPPFAVIGPQPGEDDTVDAIASSNTLDFALRLGRSHTAARHPQDAGLYYVNGSHEIPPKTLGRCTQTGMMQALIGYPSDKPPAWGDGLSIDTSQKKTPFYLVPGAGAFKFIDFDGCPKTQFKDEARTGYKFRVAWIVPTSQATTLDGAILKDSQTLATLAGGDLLSFSGRDNPELIRFGLSENLPFSSETQSLLARGFHRINTTGHYLLTFTARIRGTDADVNTNIPSNLILTCRTNRIGNSSEFYTADQVESLAASDGLSESDDDYDLHTLCVEAEDQPADTQLNEGETVEVHRHWQTVSGSTVLSMSEGELFFIYNSTLHEIEVSGVSGTLVLLSGAGGSGGSSSTTASSSGDSDGSSGGSSGGGDTTELDNRITTAESEIDTLQSDYGTLEATVTSQGTTIATHTGTLASHAISITANANAISTNTTSIGSNTTAIGANTTAIAGHEARLGNLETFQGTATASIAANAAAIMVNAGDIDDLEAFQAAATIAIDANANAITDLETFQTSTEAIFAGAIADDDYLTSTGDQFTITGGIVTAFTQGLMQYPSSSFGSGYALVSTSATTSAWQKAVYQYWEETIGGYLVPKTTSVYDLGSSTKKVRDLHLSRNAIIDNNVTVGGSLTVAAVSIVPELVSLNSWLYDNTLDIEELQASVSAGKAGLRITRSSTTQISIAAGRIHNHDISQSIVVDSPITLDLTESGDFVNGASRATATWYHVLLGHLTSDGSVVAALSTTRTKPAAWDDWQIIGAVPTNSTGSGEWVLFEQHGNEFIAAEEMISYSNTSPGTSELTIRAWCPPGNYPVTCQLRNYGGSASAYIVLRRTAGGAAVDAGYIQASTPMNWPARCTTDASGNIYLILGTAITFSEFRVHGKSYTYPIGEAGNV